MQPSPSDIDELAHALALWLEAARQNQQDPSLAQVALNGARERLAVYRLRRGRAGQPGAPAGA